MHEVKVTWVIRQSDYGIEVISCDSVESANEQFATLLINHRSVSLKLDSGAETNILTLVDFNKVVPKRQRAIKLKMPQKTDYIWR